MRLLIGISFISLILGLSGSLLTDDNHSLILFNLIESKASAFLDKLAIIEGRKYINILQHYDTLLEARKAEANYDHSVHKKIKGHLRILLASLEKFKQNTESCQLRQYILDKCSIVDLEYLQKDVQGIDESNRDDIEWDIHMKIRDYNAKLIRQQERLIDEILEELPRKIEDFIQSLTDVEKEENKELLISCRDLMSATERRSQEFAFRKILTFMPTIEIPDDETADCKWHLKKFIENDI